MHNSQLIIESGSQTPTIIEESRYMLPKTAGTTLRGTTPERQVSTVQTPKDETSANIASSMENIQKGEETVAHLDSANPLARLSQVDKKSVA